MSQELSPLQRYFLKATPDALQSPGGCITRPFLVHGSHYSKQLWDWDSYWLTKGLLALRPVAEPALAKKMLEHIQGCWMNLLEHQAPNGAIPILIMPDNPDVFSCTSDETQERNQAKPILGQYALDVAKSIGDFQWIKPYLAGLLKFHERWAKRYGTPTGLLVWGADVAVGVDNDPTTYGRPEFSSANLLLNCLYYRDLISTAEIAEQLEAHPEARSLRLQADRVGQAILEECWDPIDEFFYTVDVQCKDQRDLYIPKEIKRGMDMNWRTLHLKVKMFTGFLPMWAGLATREQARALVEKHLKNPAEFAAAHGVPTLAKNEKMYCPEIESGNPSNWLGPLWMLVQYLVYEGLRRYDFHAEANELSRKTLGLLVGDIEKTGTLHECYHPDTGKPNHVKDFFSWNSLPLIMEQDQRSGA